MNTMEKIVLEILNNEESQEKKIQVLSIRKKKNPKQYDLKVL